MKEARAETAKMKEIGQTIANRRVYVSWTYYRVSNKSKFSQEQKTKASTISALAKTQKP